MAKIIISLLLQVTFEKAFMRVVYVMLLPIMTELSSLMKEL